MTPNLGEDVVGAFLDQLGGDLLAQRGRLVGRPARLAAHRAAAVGRDDDGDELELVGRRSARPARRSASDIRLPARRRARARRSAPRPPPDRRCAPPARRTSSSPSRISIATIPCPGAGTQAVAGSVIEMRDANPSRRSPAAASTSASYSPLSSLRRRVSRLPRIGVKRAPGMSRVELRDAADAAGADHRRLAELGDQVVDGAAGWRGRWRDGRRREPSTAGNTIASSGSSRGSTAAICRPSGSTADMSLLLWTARSMSPPSRASSISLTNSRLPPISESGASCSRSPEVLMVTIVQGGPPAAAMRAATVLACQRASWLPRVPIRSISATRGASGG